MNHAVVIDTLLERDGPPIALHVLGFQPRRNLLGIPDCCGEGNYLRTRVHLPELRESDLDDDLSLRQLLPSDRGPQAETAGEDDQELLTGMW